MTFIAPPTGRNQKNNQEEHKCKCIAIEWNAQGAIYRAPDGQETEKQSIKVHVQVYSNW